MAQLFALLQLIEKAIMHEHFSSKDLKRRHVRVLRTFNMCIRTDVADSADERRWKAGNN